MASAKKGKFHKLCLNKMNISRSFLRKALSDNQQPSLTKILSGGQSWATYAQKTGLIYLNDFGLYKFTM